MSHRMPSTPQRAASVIDWARAGRIAGVALPAGPRLTPVRARAAVQTMRSCAQEALALTVTLTELPVQTQLQQLPIFLLDRRTWVQVAGDSMAKLDPTPMPRTSRLPVVAGSLLAAVGMRAMAPWVRSGYDPLMHGGAVVLLAPNIVNFEQRYDLDSLDYRRWVALRSLIRAAQYTAAPWLVQRLEGRMQDLLASLDSGRGTWQQLARVFHGVRAVVRADNSYDENAGWGEGAAAEAIAQVVRDQAVLDAHLDLILDSVTPAMLPSVHRIRAKTTRPRRINAIGVAFAVRLTRPAVVRETRRLARYFVRSLAARGGNALLNELFSAPDHLPSQLELADPMIWCARCAPQFLPVAAESRGE